MRRLLITAAMLALVSGATPLAAQNKAADSKDGAQKQKQAQKGQKDKLQEARKEKPQQGKTERRQQEGDAFLGIRVLPSQTSGVRVAAIDAFGPAGTAGVLAGDYILTVDGEKISSPDKLAKMIDARAPGDTVKLGIWRDGERRVLKVLLGAARPVDEPFPQGRDRVSEEQAGEPDAWLGVLLSATEDGQGIRINRTLPDSPADKAGLRRGDVLLQLNREKIPSVGSFIRQVNQAEPGDELKLKVRRDDLTMTRSVTLGEAPGTREEFGFRGRGPQGRRFFEAPGEWSDFFDEDRPATRDFLLEQHRRLAEQNQRLEKMLIDIHEELQALRQQRKQGKQSDKQDAGKKSGGKKKQKK